MVRAIILSEKDNTATLFGNAEAGDTVEIIDNVMNSVLTVTANEHINRGHKIAVSDIENNESILKYGYIIGIASKPIKKGSLIHIHNMESCRGRGDLACK